MKKAYIITSVLGIIIIIVIFIIYFITKISDNPDVSGSVLNESLSKSGVYEGLIEIALCCESYEQNKGQVLIDGETNPIIVIHDGVFWDNCSIIGNKLEIDNDGYKHIIGEFSEKEGITGFLYYFEEPENEGTSFLRKIADRKTGNQLFEKYLDEKIRFEDFWNKFEKAIDSKDFMTLAAFSKLPLPDNTRQSFSKYYKTKDEVASRLRIIFNYEFYSNREIKSKPYRNENSITQGYAGNYMYSTSFAFLLFEEVNGMFYLTHLIEPFG